MIRQTSPDLVLIGHEQSSRPNIQYFGQRAVEAAIGQSSLYTSPQVRSGPGKGARQEKTAGEVARQEHTGLKGGYKNAQPVVLGTQPVVSSWQRQGSNVGPPLVAASGPARGGKLNEGLMMPGIVARNTAPIPNNSNVEVTGQQGPMDPRSPYHGAPLFRIPEGNAAVNQGLGLGPPVNYEVRNTFIQILDDPISPLAPGFQRSCQSVPCSPAKVSHF